MNDTAAIKVPLPIPGTFEWCVPSVVDYREWRVSHITTLSDLAESALKELLQNTNLYRIWQDRRVHIMVREPGSTLALGAYRVEYLGNQKFGVIPI